MPEDKKDRPAHDEAAENEAIVARTTIADVYRASKQLEGVARKTRLIHSDYFSELSGNDVYLKPENLQHTGAFKLRGAYNKISQLTEEEKEKGVITASAGNHAQGVAYAAKKLGVKAVICMPATTPLLKVEATKALGAEVGWDDASKSAFITFSEDDAVSKIVENVSPVASSKNKYVVDYIYMANKVYYSGVEVRVVNPDEVLKRGNRIKVLVNKRLHQIKKEDC